MPTLPDLQYSERDIKPISTVCDYIRQRIRENPAQVVKLLIELDDAKAMLQSLAIMPDVERTAAVAFHYAMEEVRAASTSGNVEGESG